MFIVIVSRGIPSQNAPLRGIFEFDQAKALKNSGHKIIFISLDLRSIRRKRKWGKSHYFKDEIEIYQLDFPIGKVPGWLFVTAGRIFLENIFKLVVKKHGTPDLIHAHFTDISAISTVIKKKFSIPLVITEHSSHLNKEVLDKKTLYYAKQAYFKSDRIIAVSSALKNRIQQHFDVDCTVIHNIVDIESFRVNRILHQNFRLISVGNLYYKKGFDVLIQAIAKTNCNSIELLIVGCGPLEFELQQLIQSLGLENQVQLIGKKSRQEINAIMAKSDAFVLASRGETFGVVMIEAMAAGLPVITTRCGGPEDFINDINGKLVPVNDVSSFATAIIDMKENILSYNASVISEKSKKDFSPTKIAHQISQLYNEIHSKF